MLSGNGSCSLLTVSLWLAHRSVCAKVSYLLENLWTLPSAYGLGIWSLSRGSRCRCTRCTAASQLGHAI